MSFRVADKSNESRDGTDQEYDYKRVSPDDTMSSSHHKPGLRPISIFWFLVGIAWLAPAIYLLVVNLSGHVIGASAWCPGSGCRVIDYSNGSSETRSFQRAAQADNNDQNLQGVLQFAAKAMEIWFVFLLANLIYHILFSLSISKQGMPLGYALMHVELCSLASIFRSALWAPLVDVQPSNDSKGNTKKRVVISAIPLVMALVLLSIMANVIGPSIAILMIPSLNWVVAGRQPANVTGMGLSASSFDSVLASMNPRDLPEPFTIPGCTAQNLAADQFSCTSDFYKLAWDSLAETFTQSVGNTERYALSTASKSALERSIFTPSTEVGIPFSFNVSIIEGQPNSVSRSYKGLSTPSRQTLRELAFDLGSAYENVLNQGDLGNSLELQISREGPAIYTNLTLWLAYSSIITVGDASADRSIYCLQQTSLAGDYPSYTACFPVGTGWNDSTDYSSFWFDPQNRTIMAEDSVADDVLELGFIGTNRGLFYCDASPTSCSISFDRSIQVAPDACDWDQLFSNPRLDCSATGKAPALSVMLGPPFQNSETARFVMGVFPSVEMATYSLDITNISPFLDTMQYSRVPEFALREIDHIHPNWMYASWSVSASNSSNQNSSTNSGRPYIVEPRPSLMLFSETFARFRNAGPLRNESRSALNETLRTIVESASYYAGLSVLHTLSMIPYNTTSESEGSYQLHSWAYRRVWTYGMNSGSRIAGTVVMFLALLVVLVWAVVFILVRTQEHDVSVILASALRHAPRKEFTGLASEDRQVSRMRFRTPYRDEDGFVLFEKVH